MPPCHACLATVSCLSCHRVMPVLPPCHACLATVSCLSFIPHTSSGCQKVAHIFLGIKWPNFTPIWGSFCIESQNILRRLGKCDGKKRGELACWGSGIYYCPDGNFWLIFMERILVSQKCTLRQMLWKIISNLGYCFRTLRFLALYRNFRGH